MGSRHLYKLLVKTALPRAGRDAILYWETIRRNNYHKSKRKLHSEKPNKALFQRYKSYRLYLRLRQWQIANEARSLMQSHFAQKPRNPE